jgi:hypothetical protein
MKQKTKYKKACSSIATVILFFSLVVGVEAATIIDFNDGTSGNSIENFYSAEGVTFLNGEWSDFSTGFTPHPDSDGLRLVGDGFENEPKVGNPIEFVFSTPVEFVNSQQCEC